MVRAKRIVQKIGSTPKGALRQGKALAGCVVTLSAAALLSPAQTLAADEVTFHKDIEPILQRSCQNCHRPGGAGPMSLVTYEEVAPFAGLIEYKTGLRDRAGAMPPWYMEKNIGIQRYKNDPSLSDAELAAISTWARSGTPKGDVADAPEAFHQYTLGFTD